MVSKETIDAIVVVKRENAVNTATLTRLTKDVQLLIALQTRAQLTTDNSIPSTLPIPLPRLESRSNALPLKPIPVINPIQQVPSSVTQLVAAAVSNVLDAVDTSSSIALTVRTSAPLLRMTILPTIASYRALNMTVQRSMKRNFSTKRRQLAIPLLSLVNKDAVRETLLTAAKAGRANLARSPRTPQMQKLPQQLMLLLP